MGTGHRAAVCGSACRPSWFPHHYDSGRDQGTRQLSDTLIYSDQGFLREKAWPRKAILDSSWCRPAIERS